MSETSWVAVGADVMEVSSGFGSATYGRVLKIAKVYKNGNFVVDGSDQQWKLYSGGYAKETGRTYRRACLYPVTPALMAEKAEAELAREARYWLREFADKLQRSAHDDEAAIKMYHALAAFREGASPNV